MKRSVAIATMAVILFLAGCSGSEPVKKTTDSEIAKKYAPESTILMLRVSSIGKLFKTFGAGPDTFMGEPVPSDRSEIVQAIGFDPMNIAEYSKAGFNTEKEFAILLSGLIIEGESAEETSADIDILLPVTDGSKAYSYIKERITSKKSDTTVITEENGTLFIKDSGEEKAVISIKSDAEYMNFHIALNSSRTAGSVFEASAKLSGAANYKEVASAVSMGSDIAFYIDLGSLMLNNGDAFRKLSVDPVFGSADLSSVEYLKYYRGAGAAADLSSSDLIISVAAFINRDNPFKKMIENIKTDKSVILGMEKNPAILLAVMINASEYLNFMLNTLPFESRQSFDQALADIKSEVGIDLKEEVIDQLAGSVNFGMYDGATINMMNYNTVLNFNVKDPSAFAKTLEKAAETTGMSFSKVDPEQAFPGTASGKNITAYSLNFQMLMAYIIIDEDNVSLCTSNEIAAMALNKKDTPFTEKLEKGLKKKLTGDQNYFYMNIGDTYTAAKSIYQFFSAMSGSESGIDAKTDAFVGKFEYVYAGGNYSGEKAESELIIKTKFNKPFFIALQEELAKLKQ